MESDGTTLDLFGGNGTALTIEGELGVLDICTEGGRFLGTTLGTGADAGCTSELGCLDLDETLDKEMLPGSWVLVTG